MKSWLSEHAGELVYTCLLAFGNLVSYVRLKNTHGKRLDKVEEDLETHTEAGELHRNPDFESQLKEIRDQITRVDAKLDRLIERRS